MPVSNFPSRPSNQADGIILIRAISWRAIAPKDKSPHQASPIFDIVSGDVGGAFVPDNPRCKFQINASRAEWRAFITAIYLKFRPLP